MQGLPLRLHPIEIIYRRGAGILSPHPVFHITARTHKKFARRENNINDIIHYSVFACNIGIV